MSARGYFINAAFAMVFIGAFSPVKAGEGAPDYFDPQEMAEARAAMHHHHGASIFSYVEGERLEFQSHDGEALFLWDAQGWIGGDINKVWLKSEGEYVFENNAFEGAEIQALYSRAITPYWDAQIGFRHDFAPDPSRNYAVIGLQGLAPYLFEIDAALFISGSGDVSARVEVEYELLITQRLILQPRTELNFAVKDDEVRAIGAGLSTAELGVRLRYEIKRELAPYIGVSWSRSVGESADFARADGEEAGSVSFVAGLRIWF